MSHFHLCEDDCYQNRKVIVIKNLRWNYHLAMEEKWPNYRGMAAQYWMSHQYHLAFYFWCCHVERKCWQIKSGRIPFSPEAALWIKRTQVYQSLLKHHAGRIKKKGNLKQDACCCGIDNTVSISLEETKAHLIMCIKRCDHFQKHGQLYQQKHLYQCLTAAKEKDVEEAEKQILAIIQREKDRTFWRPINYILGKHSSRACFKVQVPQEDGGVILHTSQEDLQNAIWTNIHHKQFDLVGEAPLCSSSLRGSFCYNANTKTARAILAGNYECW